MISPAFILVRPQMGENIGASARAMLNFGLERMRIVAPRDGWPNSAAVALASGAGRVLDQAGLFPDVQAAIADCDFVFATTARGRELTKPIYTPEAAMEHARGLVAAGKRVGVLFGPERAGLENEDVVLANAIVTVPVNPEFASLNLAQAVILCAYEWSKGVALAQPTAEEILPPAPQQELEGMIGQLTQMLEPRDYFKPDIKSDVTRRTLRTILTKPGWSALEVRTLRGVFSALRRPPTP